MLLDVPEGTEEQYGALRRELGDPLGVVGCLLHLAGPTAGGWRIVEVWESEEALERYFGDELAPALLRIDMPTAERELFSVFELAGVGAGR